MVSSISIIAAKQADVILKSLRLWTEEAPRASPRPKEQPELELVYVPIVNAWWVGIDVFEAAQAEPAYVSVDVANQGCEADTDTDQTERWYEVAVDEWAGLHDEFADA